MKRILLSTFALLTGVLSAYAQCSGGGGVSATGAFDDMTVQSPANGSTPPKGYFGLNWYPTPDSVIGNNGVYTHADSMNSNFASYQIYQLSRTENPGKMTVHALKADTLFATFGIGFPGNGIDISNGATFSMDVDNSAQPTVPLYFTVNLTDWLGTQLQYMHDTSTGFDYYWNNYDNWYKKKFTDTLSAGGTTVNASYHTAWPGLGQSPYSTTSPVTTVQFDFAGGYSIMQSFSDTATTNGGYEDFPCSSAPGASGHSNKDYVYWCPALDGSSFDFTHVTSIAFYFNGAGVLVDSAQGAPNTAINPDPAGLPNGINYSVFKGTVLLDNFRLGVNGGCCWAYVGDAVTGGPQCVPTAVTPATTATPAAYLMPNPASNGMVTISDNSASSYNITVANTLGSVVKTATGTSFEAPTSPGMYFVTYTANSNGNVAPKTLQLVVK